MGLFLFKKGGEEMATIRGTLAIYDQMSSVLSGITSSLNLTLSAMDDMQRSMDKTFDPTSISAARTAIQQTEAALKDLAPPINDSQNEQDELNDKLNRGKEIAGELSKRIAGFVAAYAGIKKIKGLFSDLASVGMEFNSHMQNSEIAFTTMLGSTEKAREFIDELYAFNKTTPFSFPD